MKTTRKSRHICTIFGLIVLLAALLFPVSVFAQEDGDDPADDVETEQETYVQGCAECHIDTVVDWLDGPHANAFSNSTFQEAFAESQDESCLSCHTTGFEAYSGNYTHADVTCEACHGETPENHPEEPILQVDGLEACAECHTTTFREWEHSPHGATDLGMPCTTCHNPHPQQVRFETNNALCLNCHETDTYADNYTHATHTEQECTDCHWHRGEFDTTVHFATGELPSTGHEGNVETMACIACHSTLEEADDSVSIETNTEQGLTTLVRVHELEAEVATVRAQGENTSAVRLIQGIVVGLAFGGVLMFGAIRLRPGRVKEFDDHD